jgi:nitrogen fixation-related uncharacterized protein
VAANGVQLLVPLAIVAGVLGLLALFMRWGFGSGDDRRRRAPADEGLLVAVATLSRRESALALRAVLSDAGIRSTVRFPAAHRADVLVFREDAVRARQLATTFAPE